MTDRPLRIGVLYESDEWSDHKLASEIERALESQSTSAKATSGKVTLIPMEAPDAIERALECNMLVSRIFASAQFRGHEASLAAMEKLIPLAEEAGITLINPGRAHHFEVNKATSTQALASIGLSVPKVYGVGLPETFDPATLPYPLILKPNCGGRTTYTTIAHNADECSTFLASAPAIEFIAEEFIAPERGFITRIEIVDGQIPRIVRRSVTAEGLSAYHLGSTYQIYDDCPTNLQQEAIKAARALDFAFGSFDVIETNRGNFFIDANSVSNVSEDCTETFDYDLMKAYGEAIARRAAKIEDPK